jgi:His-Xaa-Ser system protein HxsD
MKTSIEVDLTVFPADVVLRTCHAFTGRYAVTPRCRGTKTMTVELEPRDGGDMPPGVAGAFANALLDQHLRGVIAEETRPIRELLVAQAFCEADLLDRRDVEADEYDDPRRIAAR